MRAESEQGQVLCEECWRFADWADENFSPPKYYCDEYVVQDADVRLLPVAGLS